MIHSQGLDFAVLVYTSQYYDILRKVCWLQIASVDYSDVLLCSSHWWVTCFWIIQGYILGIARACFVCALEIILFILNY